MTAARIVAHPVTATVACTRPPDALLPQRLQSATPPIHAHPIRTALRPIRRQSRIHRFQPKIHRHRSARYQRVRLLRRHKTVRQQRPRFHPELESLVQMPALQTAAQNVLLVALRVVLLQLIVAAVAVTRTLQIVGIAFGRRFARRTPQRAALVVVRPARALVAVRTAAGAHVRVASIVVRRTVFGFAGAELGQIAFAVVGGAAHNAGGVRPARGQIAAGAGCARRIRAQHAGGRIAARILAELRFAAVALFAALDEAVAARWRAEQAGRFVSVAGAVMQTIRMNGTRSTKDTKERHSPQAIIESMMERTVQLIDAARAPMQRHFRRGGRRHDATLHGACALVLVVLHAKVVAHLVRNRCGHHAHHRTVVLRNANGRLVRAHFALVRFADDVVFEFLARQQMRIVVGMLSHQLGAPVVGEGAQRRFALERDLDFVLFVPHNDAGERNKYVERHVQLNRVSESIR